MSGIVITLSLLACVLVISEACNQSAGSGGSTGGHTLPPSGDPSVYGPGSGPIPPHPFRRRRDMDDSALLLQSEAMTQMMKKLFGELDSDDDKRVSEAEWIRRKGNPDDLSEIMSEYDENADKLLSFDEFLAASKS